ncbi:MAB_1171c family putative transporter [Streptantibioticus parmotrematis]|uniref:MAB_1171c family putative transporter n=1 Tax=Streptantibioticus parmotrematis TaxID=2873249 RepID=UPI0033FE2479
MFDVVYLCFALAAWTITGYKCRAWLRDRGNADLGLTCVMTAAIATVFLFSAPSIYRWFDRLTGVANLAMVFLYSSVVLFATGALVLLLRWHGRHSERARIRAARRARVAVAVIAVVWAVAIVCFAVGRPDAVEHPRDFSTAYAHAPGVVAFLVLYLAVFGSAAGALGVLCPRYAARLGRTWLARGLRVLAVGCWGGMFYCLCKVVGFFCSWAGADQRWLSNGVAPLSASVAALLVLVGFAMPAAGPRASAWRRLRRLRPLWRAVADQAPEVTMDEPGWSRWWPLADLEWRANRQMAEIRDVQRAIRRYVEADALDTARELGAAGGLADRRLDAFAEAVALRRGLCNQAAGQLPDPSANTLVVTVSGELAEEHEHLARVADVYRLPLVDDALAALRDRSAARGG